MEAAHESVPRAGDRGEEEKAGEEVDALHFCKVFVVCEEEEGGKTGEEKTDGALGEDGKGGGCMCIDEKDHYEFTYDITGDAVSIDFKSDNVVDCQYTFSVDSDKLTLTGGEGTAQPGAVYELTKE